MPIPKPNPDEVRNDYINRCMEAIGDEGDNDQQVAICNATWRDSQKQSDANVELLKALKERGQKQTEFDFGIMTADKYVRTVLDCFGSDACYKYAATKQQSFDDILKKAASTLVYSNPDMGIDDLYTKRSTLMDRENNQIILPKNTMMVFRHVLTTPRKDRDGDILRTQGGHP